MKCTNMFDIDAFSSLPISLKDSDYVDLLLLLSGLKKAVRIGNNSVKIYNEMSFWCKRFKYVDTVSCSGWMYISRYACFSKFVSAIDDLRFSHSYILGLVLGYPSCCSRQIADIGEQFIDKWEKNLVNSGNFNGDYSLINPGGYLAGNSLISHVPCSCKCEKSLVIAKSALKIIKAYRNYDCMSRWQKWFE